MLVPPCGLKNVDDYKAQQLFDGLGREATLVESDGVVLRHRNDVRELMLLSLESDQKRRVKAIHRAAIRYYKGQTGAAPRAEEIYHRLMLGQSARTIDAVWDPATLQSLVESIHELPAQGQAYLWSASGGAISVREDPGGPAPGSCRTVPRRPARRPAGRTPSVRRAAHAHRFLCGVGRTRRYPSHRQQRNARLGRDDTAEATS